MKQREKDQIERLELEKISSEMKLNRLQKDLLQVNAKSRKTQQERKNLEQRLSGLKTSLLGAERRNVELHLALYNESKNNEKLTNDLKEMEIRLANTQQEKINREQRLNDLQSFLDNKTREKFNLKKELEEIKGVKSKLNIENEKLAKDLKAVTSSRSEADGERKRLKEDLQQTQTRLEGTVSAKWLLSTC